MLLLAQPSAPDTAEPKMVAPLAKNLVWLHALIILAVAAFAMRTVWAPALLAGHSAWLDFVRMVEFNVAIRAGDYLPTWSPDFYHGYGSPLFQFYAPLAYYIAEIPVLTGMDIASALKTTQLIALIASGLAMYHLASAHLSRRAALFGAILYMIAPYRMADIFVRHALAEHVAFLWLPLIVWGTARNNRAGFITAMLASAGLLLTHNVMALIGLPPCFAAGFVLSARKNWLTVIPATIGIGLASFFWWPALSGRVFTQADASLTSGHFDYHNHFVSAVDLPWQLGIPHLVIAVLTLLIFTRWSVVSIAVTTLALFMCAPISEPIWNTLPLLKYVQFPWRFLGLGVFGSAMAGAALIERFGKNHLLCLAAAVAILTSYFPSYNHAQFQALNSKTQSLTQTTADEVGTMRRDGVLLSLDQIATPEQMRVVGERGTASDDFLPRGVIEKPAEPPTTTWEQPTRNSYRTKVSSPEAAKIELQQFWFPGWTAKIDGRAAETAPSGNSAVVSCDVPAGDHTVEFRYTSLPQRRAGVIASFISIVIAAAFVWRMP